MHVIRVIFLEQCSAQLQPGDELKLSHESVEAYDLMDDMTINTNSVLWASLAYDDYDSDETKKWFLITSIVSFSVATRTVANLLVLVSYSHVNCLQVGLTGVESGYCMLWIIKQLLKCKMCVKAVLRETGKEEMERWRGNGKLKRKWNSWKTVKGPL